MAERWMKWAVGEGSTKTFQAAVAKFVGLKVNTFALTFLFTLVTGSIQMIGGFVGVVIRKKALGVPNWRLLIAPSLFGVTATGMTVLLVYTFMIGADLGIRTFITTLAIIPGAFIDWGFFKHPLKFHQWFLGIPMFLLAGWSILDFPNLNSILDLPLWVWLTLVAALLAAINEGLSQASTKLDPMVNNFWVGFATIICCGVALLCLGNLEEVVSSAPQVFWIGASMSGVVVIAMISFKLMSYKGGGSIALKKVIMQGTHLITSVLVGVFMYNEPFTVGKTVGVMSYFVAFSFMDRRTWEYIKNRFS